jgi:hypothetical protein
VIPVLEEGRNSGRSSSSWSSTIAHLVTIGFFASHGMSFFAGRSLWHMGTRLFAAGANLAASPEEEEHYFWLGTLK